MCWHSEDRAGPRADCNPAALRDQQQDQGQVSEPGSTCRHGGCLWPSDGVKQHLIEERCSHVMELAGRQLISRHPSRELVGM